MLGGFHIDCRECLNPVPKVHREHKRFAPALDRAKRPRLDRLINNRPGEARFFDRLGDGEGIPFVHWHLADISRDVPADSLASLRTRRADTKTAEENSRHELRCDSPRAGAANAVIGAVIFWGRAAPLLATGRFCAPPAVSLVEAALRQLRESIAKAPGEGVVVL